MSTIIDKSLILNKIKKHFFLKNDAELARFLEIKPQTLSSWYSRNTFDIDLLYSKCEDIDANFLLTGKGDVLKKATEIIELEPTGNDNVILLDAKAAAFTFSNAYTEPVTMANYETLRVPKLQHRKSTFYALEISGDSMHPTIYNGDHLVCRQIPIDEFVSGMVYVMWHQEHGLICKRPNWIDRKKGTILMQSDNERIASWTTHISELTAMLEAECKISFNLRSWNSGYRSEILELKERLTKVENKIF